MGLKEELYYQSPFDLSGGQKRRVAIAGVLAMRPEVLILDEPTAGLDPKGRDEILDLITAMHKERGITILLVSHSMEDVAQYVERIIVMNHGEMMFDDAPHEVFKHYKELEEIGLAAPQVTYLMHELTENGHSGGCATQPRRMKQNMTILKALREKNGIMFQRDYYNYGQYYPADSILHKLDPRVKLFANPDLYHIRCLHSAAFRHFCWQPYF